MGIVIWYLIEVPGGGPGGLLPLRVSNDVLSGQYVLDSDIRIELAAGALASSFTASMANLPAGAAGTLKAAQDKAFAAGEPLEVSISLGYFDEPGGARSNAVLTGVLTSIRSRVNAAGLLETELRGYEKAGYRLLTTAVEADHPGTASLDDVVARIAEQADVTVAGQPGLPSAKDFTIRAGSALEALEQIADAARAPLVVGDGTIRIGKAVGSGSVSAFTAATNIVSLERTQEEPQEVPPAPTPGGLGGALGAAAATVGLPIGAGSLRTTMDLTVLGDPTLRAGRRVSVDTGDPAEVLAGSLRAERVRHTFSTQRGYTCDITVVAAEPGERARHSSGAARVVDRIRDMAESARQARPAVDVAEVSAYRAGKAAHLATMHYGQSPAVDVVSPSVQAPVDRQPMLHDKPLASPFAFHRCGLMVPVLPGMRALLAHNRGLVNDAAVAGFLWSQEPRMQPPDNQPGDWWLCLPTGLDGHGMPTGPGTNDLTDATGRRVIQAKGMEIEVGAATLPEVGTRPTVPDDLDNQLVIRHASGTTITIATDGAVTITTTGKPITIDNGSASISLGNGEITLSAASVQVG